MIHVRRPHQRQVIAAPPRNEKDDPPIAAEIRNRVVAAIQARQNDVRPTHQPRRPRLRKQPAGPRPRRIHQSLRAHRERLAGQLIATITKPNSAFPPHPRHAKVITKHRPAIFRLAQILEHQPRRMHASVIENRPARQSLLAQPRLE